MENYYYKLVRDRIPQIVVESGHIPVYRHLDDDQMVNALIDKIHEEAEELRSYVSTEELADLLSIVWAIAEKMNFRKQNIIKVERKKTKQRGGYKDNVYLEQVK